MFMCACLVCVLHAYLVTVRSEKGSGFPGTGEWSSRRTELLCGCWELNLDPLDEHQMLLTPELSLQHYDEHFNQQLKLP